MSYSNLVNYTYPIKTQHYNYPRTHTIDRITIHHAANGDSFNRGYAASTLKAIFDSCGCNGSCNYGVDSNGNIGLMLDESCRSWCTNSPPNDCRAITIEVANDRGEPDWHVSDRALAAVIRLCADICKRNGIKRLNYTGDCNGNMTLHKWFVATPCPGPYLESKMPYIAAEVNKLLGAGGGTPVAPAKKSVDEIALEVIRGDWGAGATRKNKLTAAGYDYAAVQKRVNEMLKK